ncbi:glycosyltransferase family 2 protein [Sphingobium phenoxybenzoativorans]|uniref:Glycosyltransferase family 2 protein n=1 Tax=Sphingobium phenoxybenzoativorans TaxID=1592790 RepID=A0A975Q217_9SPHN|nr:glycosyltransferase family 2 protein [Sphingobium phenoxybenzoativorans]QUT06535.1 glycosyltransferase family 2 protein [Sphingobium phenoxybenzoativorans]
MEGDSAQRDSTTPDDAPLTSFIPTISIISPAYDERPNIIPLTEAISRTMAGIAWELIIVDDDSPDGTAQEVLKAAQAGFPVRCIRRIGRRGLSSAVVEGALASNAEYIAVMDADLQHDESILPDMLRLLRDGKADLVIGSRQEAEGGFGGFSGKRQRLSDLGARLSALVIGSKVSDPMSGYFAMKRDTFHACIYDLSQQGYKILLDILTSSPRQLTIAEVPYAFRSRSEGKSKLDVMILAEFLFLLIEKLTRGLIPPRFVLFCLVGGLGLVFHLLILRVMWMAGAGFMSAQITASYCAMALNYVVNNAVTYRSQRLKGWRFVLGYFVFSAVCTVGAVANIGVADLVLAGAGNSWPLAGIAGALMGAVFNFGAATKLVWSQRRRPRPAIVKAMT